MLPESVLLYYILIMLLYYILIKVNSLFFIYLNNVINIDRFLSEQHIKYHINRKLTGFS